MLHRSAELRPNPKSARSTVRKVVEFAETHMDLTPEQWDQILLTEIYLLGAPHEEYWVTRCVGFGTTKFFT